jgi:hypothetical protein
VAPGTNGKAGRMSIAESSWDNTRYFIIPREKEPSLKFAGHLSGSHRRLVLALVPQEYYA